MSIPRLNKETSLFSHSHSIEAGIRVLTDSVDSFVNMEDTYTDLNGDTVANKAASRIKQNADNIAMRVEKNDIISSINQSPEAITIDASRVNIAGAAIFTSGSLSKVVRTSSEQWYSSTSPTSRVGGTWSTVQPDISAGRYLWTRTYYSYSDGSSEYRPSEGGICVTPPTDIADTVKSVDVEYAQTTSSTAQPTSGWSTVAPTVAAGKYLWTRTKTVLSDNSTTYTRATCISGDNGMAVTSAKEQYYLSSSYSTTVDGTWSDDCPAWESGMYLWTRTFVTYANGHSAGVNATLATALNDACAKADTAISGVDVEYAQATSATVAPTDGWSTTAPRIASGRYLWTRTKTTYSSGASPTYTDAACISGDDGKLVKSAKEQYYLSTSSTSQAGGSWTDACPAWESGKYIWTRTHLTYADGTTGAANVTLATALNEANRKANATITGVDVEYADSTSSTTPPSSGWQTSAPAWQAGHYIWQRTKTVTHAGTSYSQPVCISGRDGVDGTSVDVLRVEYGVADDAAGAPSSYSTSVPTSIEQGKWLWVRTTYSNDLMTTSKSYIGTDGEDGTSVFVQSNVKSGDTTTIVLADSDGNESTIVIRDGEDGANGVAGKNGYVHTAWANSADGSSGFSTTDSANKKYLGVYTDNTAADSTDRTKYSWSLIKGDKGDAGADGEDGRGVESTTIHYGTSANASVEPSSWSTTAPASIAKGRWLWVRMTITYTDNTTSVSFNKSYVGTDGEDGTSVYVTSSSKSGKTTTVDLSDGTTLTIVDGEDGSDGTNGANGYVHTAWANSANGQTDFSTTVSDNKKYLGVYTDNVAADSTNPSSYSWSLIKGADGTAAYTYSINCNPSALVRAADGTLSPSSVSFSVTRTQGTGNPVAYYGRFVIAEHDGSSWTNWYTSTIDEAARAYSPHSTAKVVRCNLYPAGGGTTLLDTQSVPILSNGATGAAGADGKDGKDGKDGTSVTVSKIEYGVAENALTEPTYSTTVPTSIAKGRWLWVRTTYSDGSTAVNKSYVGTDGEDGTSIYVTSSSKSWGTTTVDLSDGTRLTIADGQDGANGANGATGYVHTAWANSADGRTDFSTTASSDKKYLGVYSDNTAADSTNPSSYSWSLIKGADGADGEDGKDAYTVMLTNESHTFAGSATAAVASSTTAQVIAYKGTTRMAATIGNIVGAPAGMSTSVSNNGSMTAAMTVSVTTALNTSDGVLMVPVTVDGKSFTLTFSWTVAFAGAKGDTGATGADGRGIVSIEEQYYLSTSNTAREGGSWVTTPPPYETGKYYWTRSKITYDSGNPNYSFTEITLANDVTSIANVANGASLRHQTIWRSATSGTNSVSGTTNWVTDATGAQNKWTAVRPVYNSAFPILFTATQSQTMAQSGLTTCRCTTPVKDDTTTVIDGGHVTTGTIDASKVNVTNISASEISSGTLSADRIGASSVNAEKLAANAVTAEKIRANAVTTTKIDALAVTADKVAAGAITAEKVSAGAITTAKLAANAVTAEKISTGAITAEKIGAGAITAEKIKANSLTVGLMDPSLMKTMSWYAESSTAASTATKVATIVPNVSSFALSEGVCVRVKFSYTNSASVSTLALNVNSTGALSIVYTASGGGVSPIPVRGLIQAGRVYEFIYDGTYWVLQYGNDTFGKTRYESNILAAANISAGRIICGTRDGYRNLTAEASFDMSYPLLYAGKAIAAGGTGNDNYSRADNVSYSNNVSVTGGVANKVVYLKGELYGNTFHVANSAWLTTNVPTSDDGFKYIPLGIMSTASVGYFEPSNAIWEYLDGEFGPSSFRESSLAAKTASYYVSEFGGGIRVHPKDEYDDNYLSIHSHGINVFREGVSVAFFGETVRVGALNSTNMVIDEDGFSMKHGAKAVARFGDTVGLGMSQMTKNSLTFRDYEGNHYVYFSDLRDSDTHITRVTETIIGDGALLYHDSKLTYADGGYVSVSFDGGSYEYSVDASGDWIAVDIDRPLAVGHRMYLTYDTDSEEAKAFTLGVRKKNSTVGASSYALGFETTAEGVHSYALGHNATASGGDSCAIGLDAVAGADDTIAIGSYTEATAPAATAIGVSAKATAPLARAIGGGEASGYASAAIGGHASGPNSRSLIQNATASGDYAVAMGYTCTASGAYSLADGGNTNASGVYSHASGRNTNASYENQFVCGVFNLSTSGDLFEVGNGYRDNLRSNAFRVTSGGVAYVGSAQVSSDGRVKSKVEPIDGGDALSLVMGLSPKSYVKFGRRELGFVAQEVEDLAFGDVLVDESPNFGYDDFRNLSYDGLIAPIVSVEQSLVAKLGDASERIERLEAENSELRSRLYELEGKVDMLLRAIGDDSR